jgi:uncharacterized protein (DUF3084 family)
VTLDTAMAAVQGERDEARHELQHYQAEWQRAEAELREVRHAAEEALQV